MKPQDLACFKKVAKVIGEESAVDELQKVIDSGNETLCHYEEDVLGFVVWSSTPQGRDFWARISEGAGE